jgi:hypothetical protein
MFGGLACLWLHWCEWVAATQGRKLVASLLSGESIGVGSGSLNNWADYNVCVPLFSIPLQLLPSLSQPSHANELAMYLAVAQNRRWLVSITPPRLCRG